MFCPHCVEIYVNVNHLYSFLWEVIWDIGHIFSICGIRSEILNEQCFYRGNAMYGQYSFYALVLVYLFILLIAAYWNAILEICRIIIHCANIFMTHLLTK